LDIYRHWFEESILNVDLDVKNIASGGAMIQNMENITLEDAENILKQNNLTGGNEAKQLGASSLSTTEFWKSHGAINTTPKTDATGSTCPISKCYNVKNLGTVSDECNVEMDFSKYSNCQKQTWAKKCNITWDGITNMPGICTTK
jgi:hypothetical protein